MVIDILKKILILFFVAIVTGLGFSVIVGSFCLICSFLAHWGRTFDTFITGEFSECDYTICMNEDEKGFCFCRDLPNGNYQFVYKGSEKLTEKDARRIL